MRSTSTLVGNCVPSEVAILPVRNITRSPANSLGCDSDGSELIDRVGGAEGEEGGPGVGDRGGVGVGAGGFCATATGTKRRNARAVVAKVRLRALTLVYLAETERKGLMA
jgi:hypothetical protein